VFPEARSTIRGNLILGFILLFSFISMPAFATYTFHQRLETDKIGVTMLGTTQN
jgi:hypothetical protein